MTKPSFKSHAEVALAEWVEYLNTVPRRGQTQESLRVQLFKAKQMATKAGLYDAADLILSALIKES